jgi:hypothetical protein
MSPEVISVEALRRRRDRECRLTPDRALESVGAAYTFLRERGLLTRTADCTLPSLFEACHEEPYRAGGRGFASWPATKWPWFHELSERPGAHSLDIHRGKAILLSDEVLALVDPICRAELTRLEQESPAAGRLLRHLADAGPAMADDIGVEVGLDGKQLKALRAELQRCGAVVARSVIVPSRSGEGHLHRSELARWDQAYPEASRSSADIVALMGAGLRAAVLAPDRDLLRWFTWKWLMPPDLAAQLLERGLAVRPAPGWLAAPG